MGCRCMGEGRTVPEIHLEQVSKYYRQEKKLIPAVEQINLVVAQGEFVFVTGSSGAGKSTLLQLIAGVISPSRGRIYFSSGQSGGGIALRNVNSRIRLMFGEDYGLHLFSAAGVGTECCVTLPLRFGEA